MYLVLFRFLVFFGTVAFLTSCKTTISEQEISLKKTGFSELKGWEEDAHQEALRAFVSSCNRITKSSNLAKPLNESNVFGNMAEWQAVCDKAKANRLPTKEFFEANFTPYNVLSKQGAQGTFTGYHEINLKGSFTKHGPYQHPLYRKPDSLKYSRTEIDAGALQGKNLELLYLDDPVALFFLHIQGSGVVKLDTGKTIRVGFAGKNNQQYFPIGRYMVQQGMLQKGAVSAESIKDWLYKHPKQMNAVMQQNPSYIFFKLVDGNGPIGAAGVELTKLRSLAVDSDFLPYGVPLFVSTWDNFHGAEINKLMVAQDTGSAIKGAIRGDIFFGSDAEAERRAAYQNSQGTYSVLLPKGIRL